MRFAFDTCILIDCLEDKTTEPLLHHLKASKHDLIAPLTVIGEVVHVCLVKKPSLWTRSYFLSTAGNVSSETIQKYIGNQTRK